MARITVDDCLEQVENRFALVHLSAKRVRQLRTGAVPMSNRDNKDIVLSLREIAHQLITVENVHQNEPLPRSEMDLADELNEMDNESF